MFRCASDQACGPKEVVIKGAQTPPRAIPELEQSPSSPPLRPVTHAYSGVLDCLRSKKPTFARGLEAEWVMSECFLALCVPQSVLCTRFLVKMQILILQVWGEA